MKNNETNKYLDAKFVSSLEIPDVDTYKKSVAAKIGWMKYRVNYNIGNVREGVQNYLGLQNRVLPNSKFLY